MFYQLNNKPTNYAPSFKSVGVRAFNTFGDKGIMLTLHVKWKHLKDLKETGVQSSYLKIVQDVCPEKPNDTFINIDNNLDSRRTLLTPEVEKKLEALQRLIDAINPGIHDVLGNVKTYAQELVKDFREKCRKP